MANLIIPVSVETGNSLQKLKQVGDGFGNLNQQYRQANRELQNTIATFGAFSPQAAVAAKKVADLKDSIGAAAQIAKGFNPATKFQNLSGAIQGAVGALNILVGAQALFGDKSKAVEETLRKVQGALALSQGVTAVFQAKDAFVALGVSAKAALTGIRTGIAATGIGLFVVALGTVVAYWDEIKIALSGISEAQNKLVGDSQKTTKAAEAQLELLNSSDDTLKRQGKSEREILQLKLKQVAAVIDQTKKSIELGAKNRELQIAAAERNAKLLSGYIDLISKPQELIYKAFSFAAETVIGLINRLSKFTGISIDFKFPKDPFKGIKESVVSTLFDPKKEKAAADAASAADKLALTKLINQKDQYLNDIDTLDKQANEKAKKRAEEKAKLLQQADEILFNARIAGLSQEDADLIKLQRETFDKQKTLLESGNGDLLTLWAGYYNEVAKIKKQGADKQAEEDKKRLEQEIKDGQEYQRKRSDAEKQINDLALSVKLAGIKDEYQKRKAEIDTGLKNELKVAGENYAAGILKLEEYLKLVALLRAKYGQEQLAAEEERFKQNQQLVTDALAGAGEAFGTAFAEGTDPFAAAFKSLAQSLGGYLIQLGKDAIKASVLIQGIKKLLGTPQGIIAGVALIALGALIKSAFNKKAEKGFARGGYVDGPGTETSDSIPAQLSKGEYVIKARSVRKYGKDFLNKINNGEPQAPVIRSIVKGNDPFSSKSRALVNSKGGFISGPGTETSDNIRAMLSKGEFVVNAKSVRKYGVEFFDKINRGIPSPEPYRALVNRSNPLGLDSGSRALVNKFRDGGLVGLDSGYRALVNRFDSNPLGLDSGSRALVNRPIPDTPRVTNRNVEMGGDTGGFMPFIAETKISGQDLKIILARADKRYSNVT